MERKHHALPENILTPESLANWIKEASRESFTDERKLYFTEDEISEMESQSTNIGRELIKLGDLKKLIVDKLTKGNDEDLEVTIPENTGLTELRSRREELDRKVEKGYEVVETKIYSIPNEDGNMYFFDIEGNLVQDRTRRLSGREVRDIFGMFADGTIKTREAI
jgi:hypothetical protein